MKTTLETPCAKCGECVYTVTVDPFTPGETHDDPEPSEVIDIVLTCDECGTKLNDFVNVDNMTTIEADADEGEG